VTDASLVTVIIGLAASLILIVIGGSFKKEDSAMTDRQNVGHDIVAAVSVRRRRTAG
jgi:hypothetical protein